MEKKRQVSQFYDPVLIKDGVKYLVDLNRRHSEAFLDQKLERRRYRGEHPTEIAALKCMDGRLHLPVMTETPLGIIQPFRNLGGKFDFGWPYFGELMEDWVMYAMSKGRPALLLVTYHFARGDAHRGCRGFDYNTNAARASARSLVDQFYRVFLGKSAAYAVLVGIDTDLDALVLHGVNGETVDLAKIDAPTDDDLETMVRRLYPDMADRVVRDFLPLVKGNIDHIKAVKSSRRSLVDAEHKEWVLGVGRGFDWLHQINKALIVGPFSPNLDDPILKAASIIAGNVKAGRVSGKSDLVLLSVAPFHDASGPGRNRAREKTLFFRSFAIDEVIKKHVPEILPRLRFLSATIDMNTRLFDFISTD